jgi:endogenous inhibitor of DNA gyrase (YacG/DUF329 family)
VNYDEKQLTGEKKFSCSFYLYRFGKYVSYGFSIINFCNPGVHYEKPCICIKVQNLVDVNVAAPVLPSKSDKVVDKVKSKYHPFCTKKLRGVGLEDWVAQSISIVNQMQHENAEAFCLVGFGRQKDALHLLRVFAPLVAQLETQVARLQRLIILPIPAILYSCATLHSKCQNAVC